MPKFFITQDVDTDISPYEFVSECDESELAELADALEDYGYNLQEQGDRDSFVSNLMCNRPHANSIIEEVEELIIDTSIHASKQDIVKHIITKLQEKYKV